MDVCSPAAGILIKKDLHMHRSGIDGARRSLLAHEAEALARRIPLERLLDRSTGGVIVARGSLRALVFGIEPTDPGTWTSAAVVVCAIAALAIIVPTRRAI